MGSVDHGSRYQQRSALTIGAVPPAGSFSFSRSHCVMAAYDCINEIRLNLGAEIF
jgi:hypothetical protein